ncbi:hypothetical protein TNCV_1222701 [Trichonephila clavipes]|nr:hypothetical protein TNCV_1222701 [Trichonephila clavipes]
MNRERDEAPIVAEALVQDVLRLSEALGSYAKAGSTCDPQKLIVFIQGRLNASPSVGTLFRRGPTSFNKIIIRIRGVQHADRMWPANLIEADSRTRRGPHRSRGPGHESPVDPCLKMSLFIFLTDFAGRMRHAGHYLSTPVILGMK